MTAGLLSFGTSGSGGALSAWQPLKLGGGGYLRSMQVAADGSLAALTDTYGAWVWNPSAASPGNAGGSGAWYQAVTPTSILSSDPTSDLSYKLATWSNQGVYGFAMAPSSSSTIYMLFLGYMFKSTDKGLTWTNLAGWTPVTTNDAFPNNSPTSSTGNENGPRMVVHPTDPNTCFVGLQASGASWKTTNGGTTWTQISTASLPASTDGNGVFFVFDPNTPANMFSAVSGVGVYKSTNTGVSWTKISGSGTTFTTLTNFHSIAVDNSGNCWALDYGSTGSNNNVSKYNGTSWIGQSTIFGSFVNNGNPYHWIVFDPLDATHIVLVDIQMQMTESTNSGTSWFGAFQNTPYGTPNLAATDIPYLAVTVAPPVLGSVYFLPGTSTIIASSGTAIWKCTPPKSSAGLCNWTSQTAGIEQLVSNQIISSPSGALLASCFDRCFFKVPATNIYPSTYEPPDFVFPPGGACLDWASSSTNTFVGTCSDNNLYTTTNGGTSWTAKSGLPNPGSGFCAIAALTPSVLLIAQQNGDLQVSTDGGTTWTSKGSYFSTNFGISAGGSGWAGFANVQDIITIAADRNDGISLYAYNNSSAANGGGVYRSQNSGSTWTKQVANDVAGGLPSGPVQGGNAKMRTVPGKSGHLIYTSGPNYPPVHPAAFPLYISTNGGATWTDINSQVREVWAFGVGATIGTYPRIGIWGWVNNIPGVFVSDDQGSTWTKIGEQITYGTWDIARWLEVDNTTGKVYIGFLGSGFARQN